MAGRVSAPEIRGLIEAGRLRLGMTKAEVRELLGPPDDWGGTSRRRREPSIWKYGEVELWFETGRRRTGWPGPKLHGVYAEDAGHRRGEMLLGGGVEQGEPPC
jgi:hypothetical protein